MPEAYCSKEALYSGETEEIDYYKPYENTCNALVDNIIRIEYN